MPRTPLTLITLEIVGDQPTACGAFRVLHDIISDAVEETQRRQTHVAEVRIASALIGRVIVSTLDQNSSPDSDRADPDDYLGRN